MKPVILFVLLAVITARTADAQLKEAVQLATLSPTILVLYSDIENYQKSHFTVSTIGYLAGYMIFDSKWKAALLTLALGATKELLIDGLLERGEPLWSDMKWNTFGVTQGLVFTISLDI